MRAMRALMVVAVVMMGCGPYGSSQVGRTCTEAQSTTHEQTCSSPTTYAACDASSGLAVWREYPCQDACVEGGTCDLSGMKDGTACAPSWEGFVTCKAARVAVACVGGKWAQHGCTTCPAGQICYDFACECH